MVAQSAQQPLVEVIPEQHCPVQQDGGSRAW